MCVCLYSYSMVVTLGVSILTGPPGYYVCLAWTSLAIVYFLVRRSRSSSPQSHVVFDL